jgi:hypothetical protein
MKDKFVFIGRPDERFPGLKTGKVYELCVDSEGGKPTITFPFTCPYDNWISFYENWKKKER